MGFASILSSCTDQSDNNFREYTFSCVTHNLALSLAKLAFLRRELKHVEGVLQAILDDDMADFVCTIWSFPEHLLYY